MVNPANSLFLCFGGDDKTLSTACVPLQKATDIPQERGTPKSVSVMQAADSSQGIRLVACDNDRNCDLYQNEDVTQEALDLVLKAGCNTNFPHGFWNNSYCNITPQPAPKNAELEYLVSPDGRVVDLSMYKNYLIRIGQRPGLLEDRELALYELSNRLVSKYRPKSSELSSSPLSGSERDPKSLHLCKERDIILAESGLEMFATPTENTIGNMPATDIERDCLRFYAQLDTVDDDLINIWLKGGPVGVQLNKMNNSLAHYDPKSDQIVLSQKVFNRIINGDIGRPLPHNSSPSEILKHECYHQSRNRNVVVNAGLELLLDAFTMTKNRLRKESVGKGSIDKYWDRVSDKYVYWGDEELLAHAVINDFCRQKLLILLILDTYPPRAASYIFETSLMELADDPYFSNREKGELAVHFKTVKDWAGPLSWATEIYFSLFPDPSECGPFAPVNLFLDF